MERRCFLAEWTYWTHGHFQRSVPQKLFSDLLASGLRSAFWQTSTKWMSCKKRRLGWEMMGDEDEACQASGIFRQQEWQALTGTTLLELKR